MDIYFQNNDETVFNYRTCAVIISGDNILLHKIGDNDFWTLLGGRVKMLESSDSAIKREIKEELGEDIDINRIRWRVENFFKFENKNYHEMSTIYLVNLPQKSTIINEKESFYGSEGNNLTFKWFNVDEIKNLDIKPSFLIDKLNPLPNNLKHIIHRDIG